MLKSFSKMLFTSKVFFDNIVSIFLKIVSELFFVSCVFTEYLFKIKESSLLLLFVFVLFEFDFVFVLFMFLLMMFILNDNFGLIFEFFNVYV